MSGVRVWQAKAGFKWAVTNAVPVARHLNLSLDFAWTHLERWSSVPRWAVDSSWWEGHSEPGSP